MSVNDHDSVLDLFNPAIPSAMKITPISLYAISGFRDSIFTDPPELNNLSFNAVNTYLSDPLNKKKYDDFYSCIIMENFNGDKLKDVSSLKELSKTSGFISYYDIYKSWALYHFLERYSDNIQNMNFNLLRNSARELVLSDEKSSYRERLLAGNIAYAIFLATSNLLSNEHIPSIYSVKPRFFFEDRPFNIISDKKNLDRSITPVIKRERLTLLEFSEKLLFLEELIADAHCNVHSEIKYFKRINSRLKKIFKKTYKNKTSKTKGYKKAEVEKILSTFESSILISVASLGLTNDPENNDSIDYQFDIVRQFGRIYSWLYPIKLYNRINDRKKITDKLNPIIGEKLKFEKIKMNEFDTLFPEGENEPTETEIKRILGEVDYGIYIVESSSKRDLLEDVSNFYSAHIQNSDATNNISYISTIVFKIDSVIHRVKLDNLRSGKDVEKIESDIDIIYKLVVEKLSEICIRMTTQTDRPSFISKYPINSYEDYIYPSIALGVGEMAILKKRYIGWSYGGLTKIINIIGKAKKEVITEKIEKTTTTTIFETTDSSEQSNERINKTSKEINKEINKENNRALNASGGINVSSELGSTKTSTNAKFSFSMGQTTSENKNVSLSKELINKAVEKISSKKFESIRQTVEEEITYKITDTIIKDNNENIILMDINDVFEFVPIRYGKRLMVELYIPEPAIGFINRYLNRSNRPKKPETFAGTIKDIRPEEWECLKENYPESDIPMPPPLVVTEDWKWASTPVEDQNKYGELIPHGSVAVPPGYIPERVAVSFSVQIGTGKGDTEYTTVEYSISAGGRLLIDDHFTVDNLDRDNPDASHAFEEEFQLRESESQDDLTLSSGINKAFANQTTAIKSIPISAKFFNAWDQSCYLNMLFYFRRSNNAISSWRATVYQEIIATDQKRLESYYAALDEYNNTPNQAPSRAVSEDDVRSELQKWFTKAMLGKPIDMQLLEQNALRGYELEPTFANESEYLEVLNFFECFDFNNLRYHPLDKSYGTRDLKEFKEKIKSEDFFIDIFVKAGACRVAIPISAGNELRVINFLSLRQQKASKDKSIEELLVEAREKSNIERYGTSFQQFNVLVDLYTGHESGNEFVKGVGKIKAKNSSEKISLDLSEYKIIDLPLDKLWIPDNTDIGRKIIIGNYTYRIKAVDSDTSEISLDKLFKSPDGEYEYLIGYALIGEPWIKSVPSGETKIVKEEDWDKICQVKFEAQFGV